MIVQWTFVGEASNFLWHNWSFLNARTWSAHAFKWSFRWDLDGWMEKCEIKYPSIGKFIFGDILPCEICVHLVSPSDKTAKRLLLSHPILDNTCMNVPFAIFYFQIPANENRKRYITLTEFDDLGVFSFFNYLQIARAAANASKTRYWFGHTARILKHVNDGCHLTLIATPGC